MEIKEYLENQKELYNFLLAFLESDDEFSNEENDIIQSIEKQQFRENRNDFKLFLRLISEISLNHHRTEFFLQNINKIFLFIKEDIKQTFSNKEIFSIFECNKIILYLLITNQILTIDDYILKYFKTDKKYDYICYFYPEIKNNLNKQTRESVEKKLLGIDSNIFDNFTEKQKIGENDLYLATLIRKDAVEDFIAYVNQRNIQLTSKINHSIFETNLYLIENCEHSIIEYAAFFGSIQIFQYLRISKVPIKPIIWNYVIHSQNAELIHLLEDNKIIPINPIQTYQSCLEESIKCHHNNIALYFRNYLYDEYKTHFLNDYDNNILNFAYHYLNFEIIPTENRHYYTFFYLCKYGYTHLAELYLNRKKSICDVQLIRK